MTEQEREDFENACCAILRRAWTAFRRGETISERALARLTDEWTRLLADDIPAAHVEACYDRWIKSERPRFFPQPQDLLRIWDAVAVEVERDSTSSKPRLSEWRDGQWLYSCFLCSDIGYCYVWQWGRRPQAHSGSELKTAEPLQVWVRTLRACNCQATPFTQRLPILPSYEWAHNKRVGEFAKWEHLQLHGAPSKEWKSIVSELKADKVITAPLPPIPTQTADGQPLPF